MQKYNNSNNQNGEDSFRIVGGSPTAVNRYPYLVTLIQTYSPTVMYQLCGGVLIAPDVVLTAGHCASKVNTAQIGRYDLSDWSESFESFTIAQAITHPLFNKVNYLYDYALLKLSGASTYPYVKLNDNPSIPGVGSWANVIGWGATESGGLSSNTPNEVSIQVTSNDECKTDYSVEQITDTMLCASSSGKDACQGDSGGPLIVKGADSLQDILVGIVSWGYGCADPLHPGVYSRISTCIDWIEQNTCSMSPQSCVQMMSTSTNDSSFAARNSSEVGNIANSDGPKVNLVIRSPIEYAQQMNQKNHSAIYKILLRDLGKPAVLTMTVFGCLLFCVSLALLVRKGSEYFKQGSRENENAADPKQDIEAAVPPSSPNMPEP